MSKMMKAEVEVVRFGCADVIATSSLVNGRNYYTYGAELKQSGDTQRSYIDGDKYSFIYDDNKITVNTIDVPYNSYYYAWYSQTDKEWYTQHNPFSSSAKHEWDDVINGASYT